MKLKTLLLVTLAVVSGWATGVAGAEAGNAPIIIEGSSYSRRIPISLHGFTGEVLRTLKFDLEVVGFKIVSPDKAQYLVDGSNNGRVEARVKDHYNQASILAKVYQGAGLRTEAHALSDDIVRAILRIPGIAQTQIAFKVQRGENSEIYISDYDGHNAVAVTADHSVVAAPCWVPGKRILYYTSYRNGFPDIYSQNLDTGIRRNVAHYAGLNTSAAISPNGRHLAMILSKSGSPDVYVADLDGGHLVQLTHTKAVESSPCWSPDGKTLCFVSRISGRAALYRMAITGGRMHRIRTTGVINVTEPNWSPNGKTLVFTAQMGGFNICTVPAGGGDATVLVTGEDPCWAPNSRTVIFTRRTGHGRMISLLDVPTKRVKNIAPVTGSCSQPSWAK